MSFLYPDFICTDGTRPAPNASGAFYADDDVAFTTPLQVFDAFDNPLVATVKADGYGYVRGLRLLVIQAVWKSGPLPPQPMQSFEGLRQQVEEARTAAAGSASDASSSAQAAAASAALVGAPAGEAVRVAVAPGGAAHAELSATIAEATDDKLDTSTANLLYTKRLGGARTIVLGDSIDAATNGWFPYLCVMSNQRVTYQRNAGIGGQTTAHFFNRIQADVIAHQPDICIIGGPTNDHSQGIPEATTRANYQAMVDALVAAGIKPVLRNCPPADNPATSTPWNTVASRRAVIQRHNTWLQQWAAAQGTPVLDVYSPLVDPATGGLRAAIAGDGIHPTEQGNKDMAAGVLAAGLPSIFNGSVQLATSKGEDSNLIGYGNNGVFVGDSNADGGADGWNISSATVKSLSAAVAPALGNVQHLEGDGTLATTIYQDVQTPANQAGHVVSVAGRIKIRSGAIRVRFQITGGSVDLGPFALPVEGIFYCEGTAPANVSQIRANIYANTGAPINFDLSQVAIRDRTALAT